MSEEATQLKRITEILKLFLWLEMEKSTERQKGILGAVIKEL